MYSPVFSASGISVLRFMLKRSSCNTAAMTLLRMRVSVTSKGIV